MKALEPTPNEIPLLKLLVYGAPGTGKTTLVASFDECAHFAPVLILDFGGRPETVKYVNPDLNVLRLTDIREINSVYNFFATGQPEDHELRKHVKLPPREKFRTVVIDTFTEYQQYEIGYICGGSSVIGAANVDLTNVPAPNNIKHWGMIANNTIVPARDFCQLPVNVIFTLQEYTQLSLEQATSKRVPRLLGSAMSIVGQYFNMTAMLQWVDSKDKKNPDPQLAMLWKSTTAEGGTKQDWMRGCTKSGMLNPSANKLYQLALETYEEQRG